MTVPHLSGRFSRPKGLRRWLMMALLLLIVGALGGGWYLVSPSRMAKLSGDLLAAMAGADAHIDTAHFGFDGAIVLRGVELRIKGVEGAQGRLFDARVVRIKHNLLSLLRGEFQPKTLTFINPTLHLTEIVDKNLFNFQLLEKGRQTQVVRRMPDQLPEIFIRNSRVQLGEVDQGRFNLLGTVHLSGNFTSSVDQSGTYFFTLRQELMEHAAGKTSPVLRGRLDLQTLIVEATLEQFTLDIPQHTMLPRQIRKWWERLEPVGLLPSIHFGYNPDPQIGLNADLELQDVEITLPYGELDSRMTGVSGRFSITNRAIQITDLTGQIEDIRYTLNGEAYGFSRDAPFKLEIRTDPFAIPEKPRYLLALPTAVQKQFKKFTPSGTFQALVTLERREPGGRLAYDGTVQISDAKMLYHQFKYPLEKVRGELRFNDERIELVGLRGRGLTGANVVINGWIAPPQEGAAVHVVITAVDSPVDQILYDAMPEKQRPILDMFFNQQAHQRLIDAGIIQTRKQLTKKLETLHQLRAQRQAMHTSPPVDQAALAQLDTQLAQLRSETQIPVFDLGGKATVIAQSSRPLGPKKKFRTTVGLKVSNVNALYQYWAYPLRCRTGLLLIKPDEVIVDQIELEGLSGAIGKITGTIALPQNNHETLVPDLHLTILSMPSDELLYASIPAPQDHWLRELRLRGTLDGTGKIFHNQDGGIDYHIETELTHGTVQPFGGRFKIDHITGHAVLRRGGISTDALSGRHGSSRLVLSGYADWGSPQKQLDVSLVATDLVLEEAVLDLLPPDDPHAQHAREIFEQYHPEARLDADLNYRMDPGQEAEYRLETRLDELAFDLKNHRVHLTGITGGLALTPKGVELEDWAASFGTGGFRVSGTLGNDQQPHHLKFDARADRICPTTRAVLPDAVLGVIDSLSLKGSYDTRDAELFYQPGGDTPVFRFEGTTRLHDASAVVGIPITHMTGDLSIKATREPGEEWPKFDLQFDIDRLLAAKRLISPLSLRIVTTDQLDQLAIQDLRGACYGGTLLGSGEIELGEDPLYRMNLVLQDVSLNPFLYPENYSDQAPTIDPELRKEQDSYTGVLAASLTIEGSASLEGVRRGRGELEIRNANLYEVPLALALIQILNLGLPSSRSFDRASASYLIDNDLVLFDSIRFEAPTVEIVGAGMMHYSSLELDLDLFTRNPTGPELGMLSDLITVFKDELLSIHVTGTLDNPKPQTTSFQGMKRSWEDLFGPSKTPHKPLPSTPRGAGGAGGANTSGQ